MTQQEITSAIAEQRATFDLCMNRASADSDKMVQANMLRFAALARQEIKRLKTLVVVG